MSKPDLPERIGRAINELDIDFSRLTLTGWVVSGLSLATGGGVSWTLYQTVKSWKLPSNGPAVMIGFVMIGVTVVTFLTLRLVLKKLGLSITADRSPDLDASPDNPFTN